MRASLVQNGLVLSAIAGYALMEWISRRYKNTVHASANDTKLDFLCSSVCWRLPSRWRLA